jgi:hypothetical protein
VDLYFVADGSSHGDTVYFRQTKIAIENIVSHLNQPGARPYIAVYIYGTTSTVQNPVAFGTGATLVAGLLDKAEYIATQPNPSTLTSALTFVEASCRAYCRQNIPRVTVVLASSPDPLSESRIRLLESQLGMTVIVVGIGTTVNTAALNRLASHPSRFYYVPFDIIDKLIGSAKVISSLISEVPRALTVGNFMTAPLLSASKYYTVQVDTSSYTSSSDTLVAFTTNCATCAVYPSLSEPNPTSNNAVRSANNHYFYGPNAYVIHYFRLPQNTTRIFLSILGNGMTSATGRISVIGLPPMLSISPTHDQASNLLETIG